MHSSQKAPSTSTFIAAKRTITLDPQFGKQEKGKNEVKVGRSGKVQKVHRYYIDISDIEKMLIGTSRLLERSSLDRFLYNKKNNHQ